MRHGRAVLDRAAGVLPFGLGVELHAAGSALEAAEPQSGVLPTRSVTASVTRGSGKVVGPGDRTDVISHIYLTGRSLIRWPGGRERFGRWDSARCLRQDVSDSSGLRGRRRRGRHCTLAAQQAVWPPRSAPGHGRRPRLPRLRRGRLVAWLSLVHHGWLAVPVLLFVALAIWHDRVLVGPAVPGAPSASTGRGLAGSTTAGRARGRRATASCRLTIPLPPTWTSSAAARSSSCCRARAPSAGERTLARWLMAPAARGDIRARQAAVEELRRDSISGRTSPCSARTSAPASHPVAAGAWGQAPPLVTAAWPRIVAGLPSSRSPRSRRWASATGPTVAAGSRSSARRGARVLAR